MSAAVHPPGTWFYNPATGELAQARVTADQTDDRRIETDLWLQPGAAVARAHVHDQFIERFEVLQGEVGFLVGGAERTVGAGEGVTEVAAGTAHDWWNAGDGIAHVRVDVEATGDVPASRFVSMIETLWSLGALEKVNAEGLPDPLWLSALAREYRDALRFTKPPALVQTLLFGPLAALARLTGRIPEAPELHGPGAPCVIPDPGEEGRDAILARKVGARTARGH